MRAFAFDTETTGLIDNQTMKMDKLPEVIEFYGCAFDLTSGHIFNEVEWLIKPKRTHNPEETKSVITVEMLEDKQPFEFYAQQLKDIIEAESMVIGHNLAFDKEMIDIEMKRLGISINWPRGICTVEQTIHLKGMRLNLTNLHEFLFGLAFESAHRAKADANATMRCALELYKRGEL